PRRRVSRDSEGSAPGSANPERAVERLAEDERLRGSLEDDGYAPLLDVASSLALARAADFATTDALYLALHRLIAAAVTSAERSDAAAFLDAARSVLRPDDVARLRALHLGRDATRNARDLAAALAAATGVPFNGENA